MLDSVPKIPKKVLWRKDDGKAVLFDDKEGSSYLLNETATRIWELCDANLPVGEIIKTLLEEFEGDRGAIRKESMALLNTLKDKKMLEFKK